MDQGIYIASDGTLMDFDSLKAWITYEIDKNTNRKNWSFDDFTGGVSEFCDEESYLMAKRWFDNYKKCRK